MSCWTCYKQELVKDVKAQSWLQQTQNRRAENPERNDQGNEWKRSHGDFMKADTGLLGNLLGSIQWETNLEEKWPRATGWSSKTTSSKKKNCPLWCAENQGSMKEDQLGCMKKIPAELQDEKKYTESGSTDGLPRRNTQTLLERSGLMLAKPKLSLKLEPDRRWRLTRNASVGMLLPKENMGQFLNGDDDKEYGKGWNVFPPWFSDTFCV